MKPSLLFLFAASLALGASSLFAESVAPKILISEDFESTAVGQIPQGYSKTGPVEVVDDVAHSGKKSLRINPVERGARKITKQGPEIAALGGSHWGRLYFKVKLPVPTPAIPEGKTSGIIHSTIVEGQAMSPLDFDPIGVRLVSNILNSKGEVKFLFNVQPKKRKEFGLSQKKPINFKDEWTLIEWHVDNATQSYHFYLNGEEVSEISFDKGDKQFTDAEIPPIFENLSFGWTSYQAANGDGYTAWIDDIAIAKERIGPTPAATGAAPAKEVSK